MQRLCLAFDRLRPNDMNERPHLRKLVKALRTAVDDPNADTAALHAIYSELLFRSTRSARALRKELLKQLQDREYFKWPGTDALPGTGGKGTATYQHKQGLPAFMGYRVGHSGISASKRRELLREIYEGALPRVNSTDYMTKWGEPETASRLKQLAYFIAGLVKDRKKNDRKRYHAAIRDWESDLAYLKPAFYDGRYDHNFKWPQP
jgi:hypothetical protein